MGEFHQIPLQKGQPITYFLPDICRELQVDYAGTTVYEGIEAFVYKGSKRNMANGEINRYIFNRYMSHIDFYLQAMRIRITSVIAKRTVRKYLLACLISPHAGTVSPSLLPFRTSIMPMPPMLMRWMALSPIGNATRW